MGSVATLGPLNALSTYAGVRPPLEQPRPAAPNALGEIPSAHADDVGHLELARQANHEVQKLAEALQTLTMHEGTEEHPIAFGISARIYMLTEVIFHAAALHGGTREEIGSPELTELQRRFKGGL